MQRLLLLAPLLLSFCGTARNPQQIRIAENISAEQLAPDIYLYTATSEIQGHGPVPSNGVVVVCKDEAILLDSPTDDVQTETLVGWISEKLHARVSVFIPNHWHSDCMGGLECLHAHGVRSYASLRTVQDAQREGKPIPQHAFTDSLHLELNGTAVDCHYLGGGHSDDNIVVWIPAAKLLFGGCMVKDAEATGIGNTSDAVMAEWPVTLTRILEKFPDARIVVPGHGRPGGPELLRRTRELVEESRNE